MISQTGRGWAFRWLAIGLSRARYLSFGLLVSLLAVGCSEAPRELEEGRPELSSTLPGPSAASSPAASSPAEGGHRPLPALQAETSRYAEPRAGNPQACVEDFDPTRDYFPDKVVAKVAEGFSVRYDRHIKWLTVAPRGRPAAQALRYALVQCGAPLPEDAGDAVVIEVPVASMITTSTTELPAVVMLGLVDRLLAHGTLDYVFSPQIRARIEAGEVFEAGAGAVLDIERIVAAAPGVFFSDTYGDAELDASGQVETLRAAGVRVVAVPSYLETTPLGRAEWLRFLALFFNREAQATALFDEVVARYEALAAIGHAQPEKPQAITGGPAGDTWHVPGGKSYMARFLADAGFAYAWSQDASVGSLALAFETVWRQAFEAAVWLQPSAWRSRADIVGADERLGLLPVVAQGNVVVSDARMNDLGGNDFWESGHARPDLVLADLLSLAHPKALPDHALVYLRRFGDADADIEGASSE